MRVHHDRLVDQVAHRRRSSRSASSTRTTRRPSARRGASRRRPPRPPSSTCPGAASGGREDGARRADRVAPVGYGEGAEPRVGGDVDAVLVRARHRAPVEHQRRGGERDERAAHRAEQLGPRRPALGDRAPRPAARVALEVDRPDAPVVGAVGQRLVDRGRRVAGLERALADDRAEAGVRRELELVAVGALDLAQVKAGTACTFAPSSGDASAGRPGAAAAVAGAIRAAPVSATVSFVRNDTCAQNACAGRGSDGPRSDLRGRGRLAAARRPSRRDHLLERAEAEDEHQRREAAGERRWRPIAICCPTE